MVRRLSALLAAAVLLGAAGCGAGASSGGPAPAPTLSPTGPSAGSGGGVSGLSTYVALGDSYAAAPGNPSTADAGGCERSDHDYAHLVAAALRIPTLLDVTCSGAQTTDITGPQQPDGGGAALPPQLDAVTSSTDLVTLTIGGNDLNLLGLLYECSSLAHTAPTGSPCADKYQTDLSHALPEVRGRIAAAVGAVRRKAPAARVLVVGYPQPFGTEGSCPALPLASGDYRFAAWTIDRLNDLLASVATASSATYVDVAGPSSGHDICAAQPWINGAQSADDAAPLHPFPREQTAVAGLVVQALH